MAKNGIKAYTAFFFISLASLMMLLGNSLPHHHHKGTVCLDLSHCVSHGAEIPGYDDHDLPSDQESHCTLNVNYYYQGQAEKSSISAASDKDRDADLQVVFLSAYFSLVSSDFPCTENGRTFAAIRVLPYKDHICGTSGLRAPPSAQA